MKKSATNRGVRVFGALSAGAAVPGLLALAFAILTRNEEAWIIFLVFAGIGLVGGLTGLLAAHRRRGWRAVLRATVAGLLLDLGLSTALWLAGRCASSSGWGAIISPEAFACAIFSSLAFPLACGAACAAWIFERGNE